jgi:hypothetical protein
MTTPETKEITTQTAYLLTYLNTPIAARVKELEATEQALADLNGTTCTGNITWRDKNHKPKMVITHPTGQSCPVHGDPPNNDRLRFYVGTKSAAQAQASAAIKRETERKRLESLASNLHRLLNETIRTLENLYSRLGYITPEGTEYLPKPKPNWTPTRHSYYTRNW